jgi:cytochrome c-type biogenesis protein CcmF
MLYHPPTLYLGYVGFDSFRLRNAALLSGRLDNEWIRASRRWTLFAWFALGLGNLFGAQWAYSVLGWGGYWGWDPVENASFMPWLVGTAFLHSVMIQQRRGMLKVWNLLLIIIAFSLCLFGTLVTRSGILSSVHAFSGGPAGPLFGALLTAVVVGSLALLWLRLPALRSENQLDSLVSRESSFLLNNLLLVGATFAIFFGTVFPYSRRLCASQDHRWAAVLPASYGPIFLALLLPRGIRRSYWRKASVKNLSRNFLFRWGSEARGGALRPRDEALCSAGGCDLSSWRLDLAGVLPWVRARHRGRGENYAWCCPPHLGQQAPLRHICRPHRRSSSSFLASQLTNVLPMNVEATVKRRDYPDPQLRSHTKRLTSYTEGSEEIVAATLDVRRGGQSLGSIVTSKSFSAGRQDPMTDVSIRSDPREDLYTILSGWNEDGTATFKVLVNPLVMWIWVGGAVLLLGTAIAFWPDAGAEVRLPVTERAPAKGMRTSHA